MVEHLAIQVAVDGLHCVVLKDGVPSKGSSFSFNSLDETAVKDQITKEFESSRYFSTDFDEVSLSWFSPKTTLIPNAIFSESTPQALFELCFDKTELSVDYNRISELSIVNVYEIPEWIKRFFVIKFPRIAVQHEGSILLRQVMKENTFKLKLTLVVYSTSFLLMISKHNELIFYSTFDYQSVDDILYHTSFVLQQKELISETGHIDLVRGVGVNEDVLAQFQEKIQPITEYNKFQCSIAENHISKGHQLCV